MARKGPTKVIYKGTFVSKQPLIFIFENLTAAFLLRCQRLLWQINLEIMHFKAWKKNDFHKYCPLIQFFSLNVIFIVSSSFLGTIPCTKGNFFLPWINVSITNYAYFFPKWVLTFRRKPTPIFSKIDIFPKFFVR